MTLLFRQLLTMFWLDVVICVLFTAGLLYYTESTVFTVIEAYIPPVSQGAGRHSGAVPGDMAGENEPAGAKISFTEGLILREERNQIIYWTKNKPPGIRLFSEFNARQLVYLPEFVKNTQAIRRLYSGNRLFPRIDQAENLVYQIAVERDEGWIVAETRMGPPLLVFIRCFTVILIFELLSLIAYTRQNSRSINKTLRPLQELTASARALTAKGGPMSPEALNRLTGALDSINVSHLDARLPLSGISDELKPLAAAINEMLARIDEAYREQIRFVSDASHELRTPIAVIKGYADLLSRWGTEDSETMYESIAAIRQEAEAMKEMVEQLLFLARGESDFMNGEWKKVDLAALAAEVLREIEMIDEAHVFSSGLSPGVMTEGDDGMLKQLMRILVDNSVKYTPAGGQISLRVEQRGALAAVIVQDEGAGIPEEAIPYIFDRFYRADESRTRETGGAGLGLSIAKWIAQRHNGSIEVMSRENIGTRMTLLLPLLKPEKNASTP